MRYVWADEDFTIETAAARNSTRASLDVGDNDLGDVDMTVEQIDAPIMDVLALAYDFAVDRGLPPVDINQGFRMAEEKSAAREVETMTVTLGGSPNQGTKPDKRLKANRRKRSSYQTNGDCPEGQHQMPDGTCMDDEEEMGLEELEGPFEPWHGTLAVEGVETGDGREFAPGSLEWPEPPLPLMWQRETEERHGHSIVVGRIDTVERAGNEIKGTGVIKSSADVTEDMRHELAGGISVDVDSVKEADVELVFPDTEEGDAEEDEDGGLLMLFGPPPEKVVFHRGRIRGATLVALPAFVEARIRLGLAEDGDEEEALVAALEHREEFAAISGHKTGTAEGSWDAGAVQSRLPSPMPVATARGMYAWMASGAVEDGKVNKADLKFPHHNSPGGAANTTACSAGIAALNGARGGASIPSGDRSGVHSHLAGHLRAAGKEVPALAELDDVITAAAVRVSDETGEVIAPLYPPLDWFEDPALTGPTPFHVQDGGRISGHLAVWGTCHTTFADRCVTPPRRQSYDYFHKGELKTREAKMIGVGHITLGTGHAAARHGAAPAMAHYDHTGFVAADVRCGEDQYGIWVAGSLRPSLSELRLRELRGAALSGDWRRIGGRLQLVAVLAVNVPGFPVPRMRARMDNDDMLALTAAGVVTERRVERYHELLAAGDGHGTLKVKIRR